MTQGPEKLDDKLPIIVVKKRVGSHDDQHGGAWKVAYADFVTAMMALFIVLWIVGQSPKVKSAVAGYFREPDLVSHGSGGAPSERPVPVAMPVPTAAPSGDRASGDKASDDKAAADKAAQESTRAALEQAAQMLARALQGRPELAALAKLVTIEVTEEGLRLEAREASEASFFDVGTANLKPEARAILAIIAGEVGKLPQRVVVEGHTDSRRFSRTDGYTNFELSAERANSARRILVESGLGRQQVSEVRGYADTRLRNAADPLDPANRRISILVKAKES
jgi:chemotaxis protein MotB